MIKINPVKLIAVALLAFWVLAFLGCVYATADPLDPNDPNYKPPGCGAPVADKTPLVWVQQPRHTTPIPPDHGQPENYAIDNAANEQIVGDIGLYRQQTEADLMYRDATGEESMLYNCTSSPEICSVEQPRVSPNGKRVIFNVNKAPGNSTQWPIKAMNGPWTDVWFFYTVTSELWVCELETKDCDAISGGHIDRFPEWLDNKNIVFTSDRGGVFPPRSYNDLNFYPSESQQLHRARLVASTLTNIVNISPDKFFVMSPEVMSNGQICFSHFEGVWPRYFGSTPQNIWWISCFDVNGEFIHTELGAHGSGHIKTNAFIYDILTADPVARGENVTKLKGLRGIAETWLNYLMVGSYYRSNSLGANGGIVGWESDFEKSEGCLLARDQTFMEKYSDHNLPGSGRYTPCSIKSITPWAQDQDMNSPKMDKQNRGMGRSGYPFTLPQSIGVMGYTRSRGYCYRAVPPGMATVASMGGEPTCKKQIDKALVAQILNPFDKKQTVCMAGCSMDVHAWDAQYAGPYSDMWGIEAPAIAEIKDMPETCSLRVVDAREAELWPVLGKDDELNRVSFQGNSTVEPELFASTIKYFGIDTFEQWPVVPDRAGPYKLTGIGIKAPLEADGSVLLEVPCGVPFTHFGYDKDGSVIASGLAPMSVRGDETCHGCHLHSTKAVSGLAAPRERFKDTIAGQEAAQ